MSSFDDLDVNSPFGILSRRLNPQAQFDANYTLGEKILLEDKEMQRELAKLIEMTNQMPQLPNISSPA